MEVVGKILSMYRASVDIIPPLWSELFGSLPGMVFVASLIVAVWQLLKCDPFRLLWSSFPRYCGPY